MKLSIISPFPPIKGGISKETELLYLILKDSYDINIFSYNKLYPSILYPTKNQTDKAADSYQKNKKIDYSININNPLTWYKTSKRIIDLKSTHAILRFWNPFFIPLYLFLINRIKNGNKNIKILCICDNIYPHERIFFDKKIIKYFFTKIDHFLVMSEDSKNKLQSIINSKQKIVKSFLPLKFSYKHKISKIDALNALNIKKTKLVLLFFGFIRDYKGLDLLLNALGLVKDLDIKLIIAGQSISKTSKYLDIIKEKKINDKVLWHNKYIPESDVGTYFSACDVVVLPHLKISQSGIIPLAYEFKKFVIASDIISFKEHIDDSKTGYLFEKNNYFSLKDKIERIYNNYNFSKVENNIVSYSKKYSNKNLINQFDDLLNL